MCVSKSSAFLLVFSTRSRIIANRSLVAARLGLGFLGIALHVKSLQHHLGPGLHPEVASTTSLGNVVVVVYEEIIPERVLIQHKLIFFFFNILRQVIAHDQAVLKRWDVTLFWDNEANVLYILYAASRRLQTAWAYCQALSYSLILFSGSDSCLGRPCTLYLFEHSYSWSFILK